jgi:hypothetical protein
MECCNNAPVAVEVSEQAIQNGVGLKFDSALNMVFLGVFMNEGSASIGLSLDEARHLKENLDKVIVEAEAAAVKIEA